MSGICGLFNLDHAPVAQADLQSMTVMLECRGPEGTGRLRIGSVGLGHTLLATTPQLQYERQPFAHVETGCSITADVRLDNRDELLGVLNLCDRSRSIGDAELILNAYLAWGGQCPNRLLGDFAFAIWDPRSRELFCARDHFGLRPFYYHHAPGQRFVFSSGPRAILVLAQVPYRWNAGRIADFLVPELEWIDYTSTFFEEIYRLPPGHKASVSMAGVDIVEYWKPEPGPQVGPKSDEDFEQGFLEVFAKAVEARLRAPSGAAGSMLSGGMDSGSVVAVAKDILDSRGAGPLYTFSAVRRRNDGDVDCAESQAIYAALLMPSIAPTLIHPDALQIDSEQLIAGNDEPFDGEFMLLKAIYQAARQQGVRVVLDGGAGDIVLSEGTYIARLIRGGYFKLAIAEIFAQDSFWGAKSPVSNLFGHVRAAIAPDAVKAILRPLRSRHSVNRCIDGSLIAQDFAVSVGIKDRFARMGRTFSSASTADFAVECCYSIRPNITAGRERYARIAATAGVEASDPFLDKRVVDYCARLPGRQRLQDGWPKMILRRLMADRLPEEVLWCRGKPHLGWLFNEVVTKRALHQGRLDFTGISEVLADYVDSAALARAWRVFEKTGDAEQIHSAYVLSVWLRETAQRPLAPA